MRYKREPTIRDIYVEGKRDYDFIGWIFEKLGVKDIKIYKIEVINISIKIFKEKDLKLTKNNRNKIIYLAYRFEERKITNNQVRCLIDSDFDFILRKNCNSKLILFTDYTSIEMYLFNEKTLKKYIVSNLGKLPHSVEQIMTQLSNILPDLFLVRLANENLGLNMEWMKTRKCCALKQNQLTFFYSIY